MSKIFTLFFTVCIFITSVLTVFADDTCNCEDLLKRIEQLESIVYQNTDSNPNMDITPSSTPTPDMGIKTINLGDKIILDFAEFSLDSMDWIDTIKPSDTSSFYTYKGDKDDEKYLVFWGNLKNLSGDTIYIDEMKIEFIFNGKYSYDGSVSTEENDKRGFNSFCSLKPLSQSRFVIYVSVPDEIMSIYEQGVMTFGFNNEFNRISYRDKMADLPYVYRLDFSK